MKISDKLIVSNLVKHIRGYAVLEKLNCRELIRKAINIWGIEIIPIEYQRHIRDLAVLDYLSEKDIKKYHSAIKSRISKGTNKKMSKTSPCKW